MDDTSSVYTANTQDNASVDLSTLSISEYNTAASPNGKTLDDSQPNPASLDEDFDSVLDDLKDEAAVDLPPHACRFVASTLFTPSST